ncbi:peptidylprolyl isomerase [Paucibacter sp. APW11]|uniref:peptidylprolyl isomerase n=1 Tax=Roseateles aquae TaxID=3077235 RepID=A0ABU3P623_9BURK|nr:peptidylprolyl isomerase [Paucibacter sp. APW11]MDT8998013.1 peptidylprolyl isomerase [Paucibacter sp. APW11]
MNQQMHGCGGGSCGCGGGGSGGSSAVEEGVDLKPDPRAVVPSVNGVPLHGEGESPDLELLRQRAYSELLRQAAQRQGLLAIGDLPSLDGVLSEAASAAIETLLEREVQVPEPDAAACRRYFEAHASRFATGERVRAAHILFAVTPGVDVDALRQRAEALLVQLRCEDEAAFAAAAAQSSNCPSGADGGELGWLSRTDCVPEFSAALFGQDEASAHVGVLPRLISSRFGFHIIRVDARDPGQPQHYETVQASIAQLLRQQSYVTALRQYLNLQVAAARLDGLVLDAADSPLVQ